MPNTPCGVWSANDVADSDLGLVVAGYKADGAQSIVMVQQPNGQWSVTATFPPCEADGEQPLVRPRAANESVAHVTAASSSVGIDSALDCTHHADAIAASAAKSSGAIIGGRPPTMHR